MYRHALCLIDSRIAAVVVGACLCVSTALAIDKDDPVLVGAGDIALCWLEMFTWFSGADATALLLDGIAGVVFTVGDHVYENGTTREFRNCYAPTWGRHRARTRPSPGNHDYRTAGATPYYTYFGENAGPPGRGYYSYDWSFAKWKKEQTGVSSTARMGCRECVQKRRVPRCPPLSIIRPLWSRRWSSLGTCLRMPLNGATLRRI